jgi:hypothetical protein
LLTQTRIDTTPCAHRGQGVRAVQVHPRGGGSHESRLEDGAWHE